jgi:hypothetical protein
MAWEWEDHYLMSEAWKPYSAAEGARIEEEFCKKCSSFLLNSSYEVW